MTPITSTKTKTKNTMMPNWEDSIGQTQTSANTGGAGALAAASLALPVVGNVINYALEKRQAKKAYEQDQAQWNKQNLYNHPSAMMARLKEAGLNPNLIYGTGQAVQPSAPSPEARTAKPNINTDFPVTDKLQQFQNMKLIQAQTNNIQQETTNKRVDAVNKGLMSAIYINQARKLGIDVNLLTQEFGRQEGLIPIQKEIAGYERDIKKTEAEYAPKLAPHQLTITQNKARQSGYEVTKLIQDIRLGKLQARGQGLENQLKQLGVYAKPTETQLKQQELIFAEWKNELAKEGIITNDHPVIRILAKAAQDANMSVEQLFPNVMEAIRYINRKVDEDLQTGKGASSKF